MKTDTFIVKECSSPGELRAILQLRYHILRQPWDQPFESSGDELEDSSVNAYIGLAEGNVIACGRLQRNNALTGQVRYMAVAENFRGRGLGKRILRFLEQRAAAMGLTTVQLQARENAVEFYRAQGYEVVESTFLLWDKIQHFLMQKHL